MSSRDVRYQCMFSSQFRSRKLADITHILLHRINVGETSEEINQFFLNPKYGTGAKMPYHYVILRNGDVDYCVSEERSAPAAERMNGRSIQIGLVGDFRTAPPTPEQEYAVRGLIRAIQFRLGPKIIEGHTEKPGRCSDPKKVCPGPMFDLDLLRKDLTK